MIIRKGFRKYLVYTSFWLSNLWFRQISLFLKEFVKKLKLYMFADFCADLSSLRAEKIRVKVFSGDKFILEGFKAITSLLILAKICKKLETGVGYD